MTHKKVTLIEILEEKDTPIEEPDTVKAKPDRTKIAGHC